MLLGKRARKNCIPVPGERVLSSILVDGQIKPKTLMSGFSGWWCHYPGWERKSVSDHLVRLIMILNHPNYPNCLGADNDVFSWVLGINGGWCAYN